MKATTRHWRTTPSHLAGPLLAAAILASCANLPTPDKRVPAHDPDPRCPANLAPQAPEFVVSRADIDKAAQASGLPAGAGKGVAGLYFPALRMILVADDIHGWRLRHVQQWERCRAWLHRETGSPLMAWERPRAPAIGGAS